MLPPFHGRRMQAYAEAMRDSADLEIDSWPVGEPFPLLPEHAVADAAGDPARGVRLRAGPAEEELAGGCGRWSSRCRGPAAMMLFARAARSRRATGRRCASFGAARRAVDEVLFAEIARRRADPTPRRARRHVLGAAARRATRTAGACPIARSATNS